MLFGNLQSKEKVPEDTFGLQFIVVAVHRNVHEAHCQCYF